MLCDGCLFLSALSILVISLMVEIMKLFFTQLYSVSCHFICSKYLYICKMKTSLMHYLSSGYISLYRQSTSICFGHICNPSSGGILHLYNNMYQLLYIYSIPPDDGLEICPKYTEVDLQYKLRINSASCWF